MEESSSQSITEVFFKTNDYFKNRGVFMKNELKCLKCGCPMIIGKKIRSKYICPTCHKEYIIHGDGHLTIEGQI